MGSHGYLEWSFFGPHLGTAMGDDIFSMFADTDWQNIGFILVEIYEVCDILIYQTDNL
jgi:hypothetical protein